MSQCLPAAPQWQPPLHAPPHEHPPFAAFFMPREIVIIATYARITPKITDIAVSILFPFLCYEINFVPMLSSEPIWYTMRVAMYARANSPKVSAIVSFQEFNSRFMTASVAKQGMDISENSIMQKPCKGV